MAVNGSIFSRWFLIAVSLLIAFRVALFAYFVLSGGQYIHPDSALYLELASQMIETGNFFLPKFQPVEITPFGILSENSGRVLHSLPPQGPEVFRTPGYSAFLVVLHWVGIDNPYAIVFVQELIYGLSVYIFYHYGRELFTKPLLQAGVIFMLFGSGGLVWPKFLVSETLFLPFLIAVMLCIGHYLKKSEGRLLVFAGLIMGIGAWVRPAIQYFPLIAAVTMISFDISNRKKWLHSAAMLLVFMLVISPWLARNYYHYGQIYMSGQASNMIAHYHVPMVWNWENVIPYYEGQDLAQKKVAEAVEHREKQIGRPLDAVEFFKLQQQWALKELSQYPVTYATHWLIGSYKTMYEAYVIDLYDALRVSDGRLHFSEILSGKVVTGGAGLFDFKVTGFATGLIYYLLNQDRFYLFHTILSYLIFIFALVGAVVIVLKRNCFLWIMMLASFYFTFIPGPMGYGRFRFPVDVFWLIQAGIGFCWFFGLVKKVFAFPAIKQKASS